MSKTNSALIGLVVGLAVGMSLGAVVAVPSAQQVVVDIASWPRELNVTLTNPPTIPTPPADSDGDSVPDTLDAFPTNPSLSRSYTVDRQTDGSSGSLALSVTCDLIYGSPDCVVPFVPEFLSISWNVTPFNPSLYSFQIRTEGMQQESGYSCSPTSSTFSSDQRIGTYTRTFPPVVMTVNAQSQGLVDYWECFSGIRIDLARGGTAYPSSYLIAHIQFVA